MDNKVFTLKFSFGVACLKGSGAYMLEFDKRKYFSTDYNALKSFTESIKEPLTKIVKL